MHITLFIICYLNVKLASMGWIFSINGEKKKGKNPKQLHNGLFPKKEVAIKRKNYDTS